jgi:hypothetical protein
VARRSDFMPTGRAMAGPVTSASRFEDLDVGGG